MPKQTEVFRRFGLFDMKKLRFRFGLLAFVARDRPQTPLDVSRILPRLSRSCQRIPADSGSRCFAIDLRVLHTTIHRIGREGIDGSFRIRTGGVINDN